MTRKITIVAVTGIFLAGTAAMSFATPLVTYRYDISGAKMMSYVTVNGADGSTAVGNGLYEGARRFTTWNADYSDGPAYSSFQASSNAKFAAWAAGDDRIVDISLWGYGGNGANWGENYKVQAWGLATSTEAYWQSYILPWPYSAPPPANNNGDILNWWASDNSGTQYEYANGIGFSDSAFPQFTFDLTLDTADPFFGAGPAWHNGKDGQLVFWFGGTAMNAAGVWSGFYEGNLVLQGMKVDPVPEPGTLVLFGAGLAGLAGVGRKKRKP